MFLSAKYIENVLWRKQTYFSQHIALSKKPIITTWTFLETAKPRCDEEFLKSQFHGTPQELSEFLSLEKAKSLSSGPGTCVIGGDQILLFKGETWKTPQS